MLLTMKPRSFILLAAYCILTGCGILATAQNRLEGQQTEYVAPPVDVSAEKVKLNGKMYYSHLVLEKQTLYSISKVYGVSVEEIEAANPSLKETGLKAGHHILVPVREVQQTTEVKNKANVTKATAETPQGEYVEHKVKWYEDLNSIAAQYGVSASDIMAFNGLESPKLRTRMVLKIPKGPVTRINVDPKEKEELPVETDHPDQKQEPDPGNVQPAVDSTRLFYRKDVVDLALMLPFNTKGKVSGANMDFYAGALLALRDQEAQGTGTRLSVFDISGSAALPERADFARCDAVIGPISEHDLTTALGESGGATTFISPLDQGALHLSEDNRNFIQAPTPLNRQYDELAQWVADDRSQNDRILLISQRDGKDSLLVEMMDQALSRQYFHYNSLEYTTFEARTINKRLAELMDEKAENRILLVSENETFVGETLRALGMLITKGYPVTVYAPSRVRTFDLDPNSLHQVRLHIASPYYVDYSDEAVQRFVLQYRALYNTEPSQFAFQGYDLTNYFVGLIGRYGPGWVHRVEQPRVRGLHTDLDFRMVPGGAYVNTAVRRIIYRDDYTTVLE